jgi:hypothetical protein
MDMEALWRQYGKNDAVMDIVTRYQGKVTAVCHQFDSKRTLYIVESVDDTGRPVKEWFDEERAVPRLESLIRAVGSFAFGETSFALAKLPLGAH